MNRVHVLMRHWVGRGLLVIYLFFKQTRIYLLQSGFGFVSQCRHAPTCGDNLLIQIERLGIIKGSQNGFKQLLSCR